MGSLSSNKKYSNALQAAIELGGLKPECIVASNTKKSTYCDYIVINGKTERFAQDAVYVAYRDESSDRVCALVCLVEAKPGFTSVKVMSEFEEPYYYDATKKVLKALSGPDTEWRRKAKMPKA